jgi:hypothetical protein
MCLSSLLLGLSGEQIVSTTFPSQTQILAGSPSEPVPTTLGVARVEHPYGVVLGDLVGVYDYVPCFSEVIEKASAIVVIGVVVVGYLFRANHVSHFTPSVTSVAAVAGVIEVSGLVVAPWARDPGFQVHHA